ncbi:serine hydrolase [Ventosimonas gracilis]|uniref:Serine hydrolase n=1 Tax=Ventosimonas gracilis TaxID=1680762 RepID=A0A139SVR0_9GAMM|nr:serine hydrolase domain-containing protein [Ventosimonas gracilis]KXU38542.1 serine hydrolase [Ventosimonas gracilis]
MQVKGRLDLRFEPLKQAFAELFNNPQERGAALCVQIGGQSVLDLWAGFADKDRRQDWAEDTLVNLFSCSKTFTAVCALQLVAEGKLDLDRPVAHYWPEFAAAGKEHISLRQILCHRAGLPALRELLPPEALYDWHTMTSRVAAEAPWWIPGSAQGYAAITYGWLVGELIRRVDGRSPGQSIGARIARPLGLDFYLGTPAHEFSRIAHVARAKGNLGDAAAQRLLKCMMTQPQALSTRAFANPPSIMTSTNKPEWRRMEQPAANGHGNARTLASFFSALLDDRLLPAELLAEMTREHSQGEDLTLLTETRFALGCLLDQPMLPNATYGASSKAFGHPGAGGSIGFADPEYELGFGFVCNTLGPYILMDPRTQQLVRVLMDCLHS